MISLAPTIALLASTILLTPTLAQETYDYIVVGSGPGGGPLASNLARANYTVLLLEAGDASTQGNSPQYPPQITWDFFVKHYADEKRTMMHNHLVWKTTTGRYWVGAGSDTPPSGSEFLGVYYPRGATVGGSSMINAMCTWLPPDSDWDYIQNLTGDASWNSANMRKIFQRIENNNYIPPNTPGHGFTGYFETNMNKPTTLSQPILGIMQAIAENFSLPTGPTSILSRMGSDANYLSPDRDQTTGIWGLPQHTKANGDRYSSRDYIQDTLKKNFPLTLRTSSLATKILFNETGCGTTTPLATGIRYLQGTSLYKADARYTPTNPKTAKTAIARKEVILSSGTFNTPQLLLLSGIGSKAELTTHNIPIVAESPGVGQNLQDNQELPIIGETSVTATGFTQAFLMLRTPHSPDSERDVFVMQGANFAFRGFVPSNQSNSAVPIEGPNIYGISMVKAKPRNRKGYVRLVSTDAQDMPEINFNLFAEGAETDRGAMKDTIAWARKIYDGAKNVTVKATEPPCPQGPDVQGYCGEADEEWITGQTFGHHPTSTAAIGAEGDAMAVLDSRFRVRGVRGLRVVDASVFPRIPGVFPVVSTFMISEKASDVVKEDAGKDVCVA
ncbi:alcohol oxidase [Massarina eburnea CBS 473.64]|uniref:Alcohol oxidase n=1 Tax=Massarina eburnea CBS 473.64 TaxID=1395130 RepID=A0A6A6RNL5_9PLEO|nr:alcohol oxidase [Massarina eburnea CBS 473.64]